MAMFSVLAFSSSMPVLNLLLAGVSPLMLALSIAKGLELDASIVWAPSPSWEVMGGNEPAVASPW